MIIFTDADRKVLDQLGLTLYESNRHDWHSAQEFTFGVLAVALFDIAMSIVERETEIDDAIGLRLRLANAFYASFDGDNTGSLIEEIINNDELFAAE